MTAPLKLWLNLISVSILGESNFSYRFVDALSGCGTFLVMYLFALALFSDRRIGVLSIFALLGCRNYIFLHGPRQGVLDSPLLFFTTVAMYAGWRILARHEAPDPKVKLLFDPVEKAGEWGWAVLGGLALGLGFMTKSVAALPPLAIVGLYAVTRGSLSSVLRLAWKEILLCLSLAILIPLPYYLGHCLFSAHACESLITVNVLRRVTDGYINQDNPYFYLRRIFVKRELVPPELLGLAVLWGLWNLRKKELHFLLLWALIPLAVYSFIPSRLPWYIAASYPAFALLASAFLVRTFDTGLRKLRDANRHWQAVSVVAAVGLLFFGGMLELGWNLKNTAQKLLETQVAIPYDTVAREILRIHKADAGNASVLFHETFNTSYREMPYRNMLQSFTTRVDEKETFRDLLRAQKHDFVFSRLEALPDIAKLRPVSSYALIRPIAGRSWPMVVASWRSGNPPKSFSPVETAVFLHGNSEDLLYGWAENGEFTNVQFRRGAGSRSALTLNIDDVMATLGLSLTPHLAVTEKARVTISINDKVLGKMDLEPGDFHYQTFSISPSDMLSGKNPLLFALERLDGKPIAPNDKILMLSSLRVKILQSP